MHNKNNFKAALVIGLTALSSLAIADDPWSGFYGGATLGNRQATSEWKTKSAQLPFAPHDVLAAEGDTTDTLQQHSLYTGGFLGYNWHLNTRVVVGLEASLGYAHNSSSIDSIPGLTDIGLRENNSSIHVTTDWDASLVGRLGYLLTPDTLVYGLGGVTAERVQLKGQCRADGTLCAPETYSSASKSDVLIGWTAGLGLEMALADRVTGRVEYRYSQYEDMDFNALETTAGQSFGVKGRAENNISQTVSLGLSYRF